MSILSFRAHRAQGRAGNFAYSFSGGLNGVNPVLVYPKMGHGHIRPGNLQAKGPSPVPVQLGRGLDRAQRVGRQFISTGCGLGFASTF